MTPNSEDRTQTPLLDTSYHDRFLRRQKRNPWFRFWFWRETRRLKASIRSASDEQQTSCDTASSTTLDKGA